MTTQILTAFAMLSSAIASVLPGSQASTAAMSFRGVQLRMTKSELYSLQNPFLSPAILTCRSDAGSQIGVPNLNDTPAELKAGIIKCSYGPVPTFDKYVLTTFVAYLAPTRGDLTPRIYFIEATSLFHRAEIKEGLIAKYGAPTPAGYRGETWENQGGIANLQTASGPNGFSLKIIDPARYREVAQFLASYRPSAAPL